MKCKISTSEVAGKLRSKDTAQSLPTVRGYRGTVVAIPEEGQPGGNLYVTSVCLTQEIAERVARAWIREMGHEVFDEFTATVDGALANAA